MMNYSIDSQKITMLVGGGVGFKRLYGQFAIGPQLSYYQSIDSHMFNIGLNLMMEYKF